ncbi:hypothetical protein BU24DRAFT_452775 [Aaosphaeria arxii CBS 175.79]|uniref:Uncharacterized protein n=1 Tax=Aaosphaeria arxii CBS 175.79 TaxID=1450172 RepID=A0A6A5XMG3_9PLEO|nr:uncharacterized protein BU24DRAFT_452775 [Aaosphaeria arxii CBS 175.79]KAF2014001.1 hypothetical protein BU24DRAFT_452775 [Aaosphaeria arxii CBS 175.79]
MATVATAAPTERRQANPVMGRVTEFKNYQCAIASINTHAVNQSLTGKCIKFTIAAQSVDYYRDVDTCTLDLFSDDNCEKKFITLEDSTCFNNGGFDTFSSAIMRC